jgi:hypothetical protein
MVFSEQQVRVFLYGEPVSMRLSFDGWYVLSCHRKWQDPTTGNLFAFINKPAYFWPVYGELDEIDTHHLERALHVIPMGRRNGLFTWTELGAKHVGIVQSLLVTCRLHDINPYDYFVDVLQRVGQYPAARGHELTPRLGKQRFVRDPLRSDLHPIAPRDNHCAE